MTTPWCSRFWPRLPRRLAGIVPRHRAAPARLAPLPPTLDPLQRAFACSTRWPAFWKRAAARQPLLLILDDLHWADASSLQLLEFLAPELQAARLLLLLTLPRHRTEPPPPLVGHPGGAARQPVVRTLAPARPEPRRDAAMICGRGRRALRRIAETVHCQTEGVPLFIVEMTSCCRRKACSAAPTRRAGTPRGRRSPRVSKVIGRRRQPALGAERHGACRTAALIGRVFRVELLQQLLAPPRRNACRSRRGGCAGLRHRGRPAPGEFRSRTR